MQHNTHVVSGAQSSSIPVVYSTVVQSRSPPPLQNGPFENGPFFLEGDIR